MPRNLDARFRWKSRGCFDFFRLSVNAGDGCCFDYLFALYGAFAMMRAGWHEGILPHGRRDDVIRDQLLVAFSAAFSPADSGTWPAYIDSEPLISMMTTLISLDARCFRVIDAA